MHTLALTLALVLPTGVGVGVRAEQRAGVSDLVIDESSALASEDPFAAIGADVMIEPNVHGKAEADGVKLEGAYAPQMVFRLLSGDARPLVLHSLGGRMMGGAPRVSWYGGAGLEIGELDFSRAVREMKVPGSVPEGTGSLDAIPYMMAGANVGASFRATRFWTLSLTSGASLSGASAERLRTAFPLMSRPFVEGRTSHRLTRFDTVEAATRLETVVFSTGASYYGVSPTFGYTRQFGVATGSLSTRGGALFTQSTPYPGQDGVFHVHPIADVQWGRALKMSDGTKAETSLLAGVGPYFDPFTSTLDERGTVSFGTKIPFGRVALVTQAAWLVMLNWARPEFGYGYIGGRGQQSDHVAILDTRVVYDLAGPLSLDVGTAVLGRWDEPSFPTPTKPGLEAFLVVGLNGGLDWPKPPDRAEEAR
jgi:hypothetical protein